MIGERRKYIRVDTRLNFGYKRKDSKGPVKKAVTKNISPSGIRAELDPAIKKGDWLEVVLYLPQQGKPISSICKVTWTANETASRVDAGIKFEEIAPLEKNLFLEYLCNLMASELDKLKR